MLVLIKLHQVGSAPTTEPQQRDEIVYIISEESPREYFATQLLDRLGNTQPSPEIIAFVVEWTIAEDVSNGAIERNNPLNTTQSGNSENTIINSSGVRGYSTFEDGLNASVETIVYGDYVELLSGLQNNDPQKAFDGLIRSPWSEDHYNDGMGWPNIDIIEVQEIQNDQIGTVTGKKHPPTDTMNVNANFYSTGSWAWGDQYNGMHLGTDFIGNEGDTVYAPFDCLFHKVGFYGNLGTYGNYFICYFLDGTLFYSGHLKDTIQFAPGELVTAGTPIGYMNELNHTHIKLEPPGSPTPCEGAGTCIDFEEYYATH